ncbi:hypothetical protein [Desulfosporosinus sp.]|nr:hypothetical protein [Desulfosporosinus sp.]MBC2721651.1 hypothetical protein [Desulfosporosinus sp.]
MILYFIREIENLRKRHTPTTKQSYRAGEMDELKWAIEAAPSLVYQ